MHTVEVEKPQISSKPTSPDRANLKLSDFKSALASADVAAEFIVGSLTCAGGTNCIRKETDAESDALVLDGSLSDDFYTIRSILYDRYQITA